jgi:hypothetical protein
MMSDTVDLLLRASRYIAASVRTVTTADGEHEPASEGDHEAHDLACALAVEAVRLSQLAEVPT